nr:hypothetical protein [Tanacetum cinerariifolium]
GKSDVIVVPDSENTLMHAEEIKERTTATAITEGTWGFKHTKACFRDDIILFVKNLKELFTSFDQCLIDEVTEVQKIFKQMELAVEQHCAEKTKFQTKMENVLNENDRLLTHALSVEIVNIVVHDCMNVNCLNMDACEHYVTIEFELKIYFIRKECYETLLQQYHILETHCISLEVNNQLNTEIFQRDTVSSSKSALTFAELFETNELKAQIQEKNTVILKLKEKIKSSSGDVKQRKVERDVEDLETLNLELDHKCDDLINKVNLKSVEVADLNASLQEKVLVITALKEQLKGKTVLNKAISLNPIDPALLQVDVVPLVPKLRKNRTAHIDYIRHTQEEVATLRELVESERLLSPLNTSLAYALQTDEPNLSGTTIVEVSKELPKASMVNSCLKKLKFHLASFDMVVKERTTATAITKGTWGFEHTKDGFRDDIIPFVQNLKELFTSFDQCLIDEVTEVQNIFKQMELAVEQHCAEKTKFQTKMENVLKENDRLLTHALSVEIVNIVINDYVNFDCLKEKVLVIKALKEQLNTLKGKAVLTEAVSLNPIDPTLLQEKVLVIKALKEQLNTLKGKAVLTEAVSLNPIDPTLLQVDVAPLVPKLVRIGQLTLITLGDTQEEAATLREIVESERLLSLLNTSLAYACKYTRRIQELLMILQQTCPSITHLGTKLVPVTPMNKTKQIRRGLNRPLVFGLWLFKAHDRRLLSAHQFCTEVSWHG